MLAASRASSSGAALGPWVAGALYDRSGNYVTAFYLGIAAERDLGCGDSASLAPYGAPSPAGHQADENTPSASLARRSLPAE